MSGNPTKMGVRKLSATVDKSENPRPNSSFPRTRRRTNGKGDGTHPSYKRWRKKHFGGDFDPIAVAVDEAVRAFSRKGPERDRAVWLRVANQIGEVAFRDKMRQMLSLIREAAENCVAIHNKAAYFQRLLNSYTKHHGGDAAFERSCRDGRVVAPHGRNGTNETPLPHRINYVIIRHMNKIISAVAAMGAALSAQAVDIAFKDAVSGVIEMSGDGTGDVIKRKSDAYRAKTGALYGFEYRGREVGSGLIVAGSSAVNVDRRGPDAGWYEYKHAYQTQNAAGGEFDETFHAGHYHGKGEFYFKDFRFHELKAEYAERSGVALGHGESVLGNVYRFDTAMQGFSRNHSRPLRMYRKSSFNSNHWNINAGSEVVYCHEVTGRAFRDGKVSAVCPYFPGKGPMYVEASMDGTAWKELATVTNKCSADFAVPAEMFPANRLFVRLRGGAKSSLQVSHYSFEAQVDGAPMQFYGSTRYVDAATGALFGEVKAPVFAEPIAAANAQRLCATGGAAVWGAVADVKVFRQTPLPSAEAKALKVSLAGNEAESVQLVVTPGKAAADVRVAAKDLVLKRFGMLEKARIPASRVRIDRLAYVKVAVPTDETGARGDWPDPLLPQDEAAFPVEAGANQPFWITVKTPKGLPAGIYRGEVEASIAYAGGGSERVAVPFEVEVFGFDLPDHMTCETGFGFSVGRVADFHAVKPGSREHDEILEKYVQMMADHHISIYHWGKGEGVSLKWRNEKDPAHAEPEFDWEQFDDAYGEMFGRFHFNAFRIPVSGLGHGFQKGFTLGKMCGVSQTNELYHTVMAKYLGGIERHLREIGLLERSYVYWFDEPQRSVYPQVNAGMLTLKRHAPGLRRLLTESPEKELWEGVNLWNPRLDTIYSPDYKDVRARGDQFWWYICCGPRAPYPTEFIDHFGCELRTWLWMTWSRNITGVLIWETSLWSSRSKYPDKNAPQNPYEDAMSWSGSGGTWGNGDGRFVYPPVATVATPRAKDRKPVMDGPNSSYRLEILRDGIEDYEYFALLRKADPANPLLKVPETVFVNERSFSPDPSHMRWHRAKLAREIERLGGDSLRLPPPSTCVAAKPTGGEGFRVLETKAGPVAANRFDDRIEETLWRVENGELDSVKAKAVALVLGASNRGCTPEDMAAGMRKVVDAIRRRRADMKVLVYAPFPCRRTWSDLRCRSAAKLYAALADGDAVIFRDIYEKLPLSLFLDGVNPGPDALAVWMDDIAASLK